MSCTCVCVQNKISRLFHIGIYVIDCVCVYKIINEKSFQLFFFITSEQSERISHQRSYILNFDENLTVPKSLNKFG